MRIQIFGTQSTFIATNNITESPSHETRNDFNFNINIFLKDTQNK